jgi:hypothetical protein
MEKLLTGTPEQFEKLKELMEQHKGLLPEIDEKYYIDDLWSKEDVQYRFECNDAEAEFVLYKTFESEVVNDTIHETIGIIANIYDFKPMEDV